MTREPEWMRLARATEADRLAEAKHERDLLDETESVEAMESHWRGVFAADPYPELHYPDAGWLEPAARGPHG